MKIKFPLIHPTVLLKDITRFCPVWIIYSALMVMITMSMLGTGLFIPDGLPQAVCASLNFYSFISLIYSIICAMCLFGDLCKPRSCNALHAMPLRRECWFATHTLAGILFFLVPNTIVALLFLPLMGKLWFLSPLWLLNTTAQSLFFFSLAVFCVTLSGNRIATITTYLITNFLAPLCYWFLNTYYAPLLPGLHIRNTVFNLLCPVINLSGHEFFRFEEYFITHNDYSESFAYRYQGATDHWWYLAALAPIALGLLGLALLLYRKRKLESAGDFLAVPKAGPVFHLLFTLAIGAVFQGVFSLFSGNVISMVVGLAVGCMAGLMLLQRTVKIFTWRNMLRCGCMVGILVLSLVITFIDPLGLTRWVPKADRVESVVLSDDYEYVADEEYYYYYNSSTVTDPELIENMVDVHGELVKRRFLSQPNLLMLFSDNVRAVHITYRMKSGIEVSRRYYYTDSEIDKQVRPMYCTPDFLFASPDWDTFAASITEITVDDAIISPSDYPSLLEAIRSDCKTGALYQGRYSDTELCTVSIITGEDYHYLSIYEDCDNVKAWLKNHR